MSKKRVLEAEFGVLVQLSFNLHEDPRDIFHHFALLLKVKCFKATWRQGVCRNARRLSRPVLRTQRLFPTCRDKPMGRSLW